ncbi:hypothetical protein C942_04549 [Photobacterium marinum]|uniref:Uncharacterized protein n=1 Tax=Photobacterium marinum TaxID=1056511 RepID=L8JDF8_9GAMM|nr:hypothetical protein C942_04549 [Photobacterium marinum]
MIAKLTVMTITGVNPDIERVLSPFKLLDKIGNMSHKSPFFVFINSAVLMVPIMK